MIYFHYTISGSKLLLLGEWQKIHLLIFYASGHEALEEREVTEERDSLILLLIPLRYKFVCIELKSISCKEDLLSMAEKEQI